jgi:hypothetical protein
MMRRLDIVVRIDSEGWIYALQGVLKPGLISVEPHYVARGYLPEIVRANVFVSMH